MAKLKIESNMAYIDGEPIRLNVSEFKVVARAGDTPEVIMKCLFDEVEIDGDVVVCTDPVFDGVWEDWIHG